MNLVLHIGTQKTGSKAIQAFLKLNQDRLKDHGILYPTSYRIGPWHRPIFENFKPEMLDVLQKESEGYRQTILSFEEAYLTSDHVLDHLRRFSRDAKILILVRNQVDWINSFINQLYKAGRISASFIQSYDFRQEDIFHKLDVNAHLLRWEKAFGISQIKVVLYDHSQPLFDIVLDRLSFPEELRKTLEYPKNNLNKSADLKSIKILFAVKNKIGDENLKLLREAVIIAHRRLKHNWIDTRIQPAVSLLRGSDIADIISMFEVPNRNICDRYALTEEYFKTVDKKFDHSAAHLIQQITEDEMKIADEILSELR